MATTGPITTALADVATVVATATAAGGGALERATPFQTAPVRVAVDKALALLEARIVVVNARIIETSVAGVVAGLAPTQLIAIFNGQFETVREAAFLYEARAYLKRLRSNMYIIGPVNPMVIVPPQ